MARILVVEDDECVRKLLVTILSIEGYQVEEAASAAAALEVTRSCPPDLIITDILMPDTDGLELITAIRGAGSRSRIIAVSASGRCGPSTYLEMAVKLGADRAIEKPFRPDFLLRTVRELLD
jgi:CheY-like chemotaxis protein